MSELSQDDDQPLDLDTDSHACQLVNDQIHLGTINDVGEFKSITKINRDNIRNLRCEEFRDVCYRNFKFVKFLTLGTLIGLGICVYLIGMEYRNLHAWPGWSFVITTVLPVLALSSFAGILFGLMLPARSIQIYMLFTIQRVKGSPLYLVVARNTFRKIRSLLARAGFELQH